MPYEIIDIPLAAGLNTKAETRAMQPPGLSVCKNAQFDEIGGTQTRKPYAEILDHASNIIADIRKIVEYEDEFVAFSKGKLWSYASGDGLWTERAEHLAVDVDEHPRFVSTAEQYDCDRIEKDGVTMYCWSEDTQSGTASYVAAIDSATGAVKLSPTEIKAGATRPRLVTTTNKICLAFAVIGTPAMWFRMYDPADLSSSEASQGLSGLVAFDIIQDPNTPTRVIAAASRGTSYQISRYDETPSQVTSSNKARTTDGAISVASDAIDGDAVCVAYSAGTAVRADILNDAFTDQTINSVITAYSTTVNQISAVYDGASTCEIFCSSAEATNNTQWASQYGSVDNAGTSGTPGVLVNRCGLASKAFEHDGSVYIWVAFAQVSVGDLVAQLQNSYFLYRSDGLLVAKAVASTAGGFSVSEGYLPGVQDLGSNAWAWCGINRGIVALGQGQKGYSARSPQDVVFAFDSDEARRTAVLGKTLYISGGQLMQFDGTNLVEVGFHTYPWDTGALPNGAGTPSGTHNYFESYSWHNAKGEVERGTKVSIFDASPVNEKVDLTGSPLHITAKTGTAGEVAVEFWRQVDAAPVGAPAYLVTSKDPSATGDNGYVENAPSDLALATITDNLSDAELIKLETWPENGGLILESLAPPAASIIVATQSRLIVAGIPGYPNRVGYSKERVQGEIASFHDILLVDIPPSGGDITAIAFLGETVVAFEESAIYALDGNGLDNGGGGQNYGPPRALPADVGAVSQEAVALAPNGIIFKSSKGWYLLGYGGQAQYIGAAVADYDSDTVKAIHVMEDQHQVRILTDARILIWDWLVPAPDGTGAWSEWSVSDGVSACMFGDTYHYTNGSKVLAEQSDWSEWNGPAATLNGSIGVATTTVNLTGDVSDWPIPSALMLSRGLAVEEVKRIASRASSTQVVLGTDSTDNAHADGATAELAFFATQSGAIAVDDTTLTIAAIDEWPTTGYALLGYGTANVETVTFIKDSATTMAISPATKTHSHGDEVVGIAAESQGLDLETGWIKFAGLQGYKMVQRILVLGEYLGAHDLRIRVAYNYAETAAGPTWVDDKTITVSPTVINGPLQIEYGPQRGKCQSIKIRITAQTIGTTLSPLTEALKLTALSLRVGLRKGQYQGLPAAQRQ